MHSARQGEKIVLYYRGCGPRYFAHASTLLVLLMGCSGRLFALGPIASQASESSAKPAPPAFVHVIEGLGKGTVDLDEGWQFHTGDDPAWASSSFDDAGWTKLRGDKT